MNDAQHPLNALPQGYRLDEYELVRVLGFGGFGMTYLGYDHNLDKAVAIKEYLPSDIAARTGDNSVAPQASQFRDDFEWGLDRFVDEARTLARFDHRHIIKVHRFFQAHGTAYIVMEYAEGETLSAYLNRRGTLQEAELTAILYPILDGLAVVHSADFLHRDIKPGNIIIRDEDKSPVLLDFGAARQAIGSKSRSITSIITPGYAPIEQYSSRGIQGTWTDIYALGAVCYRALTGEVPDDATDRVIQDTLLPVVDRCSGHASRSFLSSIDRALQVNAEDRPQSISEWRAMLGEAASGSVTFQPSPVRPGLGRAAVSDPSPSSSVIEGSSVSPARPPAKSRGKLSAFFFVVLFAVLLGGLDYYHQEVYIPAQERQAQAQAEAEAEQRRIQEAERVRQSKFKDCVACPEMIVVPSGSFQMGSPPDESGRGDDEGPQHRVSIGYRFAVGVYEVTFSEWDACVESGGCNGYHPDDKGWGRGNRPVINVSWTDAQSYVDWLSAKTGHNYGLLSESEWEYVARAGTTTRYSWGNNIGHNRANCDGCDSRWDDDRTAPVGAFNANAWGVHDMHGNVWEWVEDCWNDSYVGAPSDGSAWTSGDCGRRVLRGGSWFDYPRNLRSANRYGNTTEIRDLDDGFRVVRRF